MSKPKIPIPQDKIQDFCESHHVKQLAFFGSVLTDDFKPESDIDILVDFQVGHTPSFLKLAKMEKELTTIFDGKTIDLRTPKELSRFFRDDVLNTAWVQYEQS